MGMMVIQQVRLFKTVCGRALSQGKMYHCSCIFRAYQHLDFDGFQQREVCIVCNELPGEESALTGVSDLLLLPFGGLCQGQSICFLRHQCGGLSILR